MPPASNSALMLVPSPAPAVVLREHPRGPGGSTPRLLAVEKNTYAYLQSYPPARFTERINLMSDTIEPPNPDTPVHGLLALQWGYRIHSFQPASAHLPDDVRRFSAIVHLRNDHQLTAPEVATDRAGETVAYLQSTAPGLLLFVMQKGTPPQKVFPIPTRIYELSMAPSGAWMTWTGCTPTEHQKKGQQCESQIHLINLRNGPHEIARLPSSLTNVLEWQEGQGVLSLTGTSGRTEEPGKVPELCRYEVTLANPTSPRLVVCRPGLRSQGVVHSSDDRLRLAYEVPMEDPDRNVAHVRTRQEGDSFTLMLPAFVANGSHDLSLSNGGILAAHALYGTLYLFDLNTGRELFLRRGDFPSFAWASPHELLLLQQKCKTFALVHVSVRSLTTESALELPAADSPCGGTK